MVDIDAIKADREAGTPGPWSVFVDDSGDKWTGWPLSVNCDSIDDKTVVRTGGFWPYEWDAKTSQHEAVANARRIARVPDLENAVIENAFERELDRVVLAETLAERDALTARVAELEADRDKMKAALEYILDGYGFNPPDFRQVDGELVDDWITEAARAALAKPGDAP